MMRRFTQFDVPPATPEIDVLADGELLARFHDGRDEAAFALLMARHGSLVYGVCRRRLGNAADAEDAFQASFLILARRSSTLVGRPSVGPWMMKVAWWTSGKLLRRNCRLGRLNKPLPSDLPGREPDSTAEISEEVDAALLALPEKYRAPVILCHLQGFGRREAAVRLGCSEGTLSSLLSRALTKLRRRLRDRVPAPLLAGMALAVAPRQLFAATVKAACCCESDQAVADIVSFEVLKLSQGAMYMVWLKPVGAMATAAVIMLAFVLAAVSFEEPQPPQIQEQPQAEARPAVPPPAATDAASALYGGEGLGEDFAPASAQPSTPLRARKGDSIFRLTNAKVEPVGRRPFPTLVVEYERVGEGPYNGQSLIVRRASGRDDTYLLLGPMGDRAGKLEINLGFGFPRRDGPPKDSELYFTRQELRYGGGFAATFKVSNSTTIGSPRLPLTMPRRWTADETAKLRQPPPEEPKFNVHPEAGEDTDFAGDASAGSFRYAEPGKPVLGVQFWAGEWDKEPCIARLTPVYEAKEPLIGVAKRVMAKPGYALGGISVKTKRYVNSFQLTFNRLRSGGKLDPADKYQSEWLGPRVRGVTEVKLGGDGRMVIGMNCRQGAILNALALVMETPAER